MINENNPFYKWLTLEDKHHIEVVSYLKTFYPDKIAFHVPNESRKSNFERYKHSLMGAMKGCPDFVILEPKTTEKTDSAGIDYLEVQYYGLLIELKAPEHERVVQKGKRAGRVVKAKGKPNKEQIEVINRMARKKFRAVVCFGADEAISEIDNYFRK